jgi:hypothetical protein
MTDREHWEWSDETGPRGNLREAVGLFDSEEDMQAAVDDLESHGFSNAAISRPAPPDEIEANLHHSVQNVGEIEDDASVPREAYVDRHSASERTMVTVLIPVYIALLIAAGIAASHGFTAMQGVVMSLSLGGIGALGGGFFAYRFAHRRSERAQKERSWGGLLLWVRTGSPTQEQKAVSILKRNAGRDVHMHGPSAKFVH